MTNERRSAGVWILVLLLILGIVGLWAWNRRAAGIAGERHVAELTELEARLTAEAEDWAGALADRGADGLFRAFAAGIQPSVLAGRTEALLQAKNALLGVPDVSFVHVLAADGNVLVSSDDKLTLAGDAGETAAWALGATELARREGGVPGSLELAGPIRSGAETSAVLWVGFNREQMLAGTRP